MTLVNWGIEWYDVTHPLREYSQYLPVVAVDCQRCLKSACAVGDVSVEKGSRNSIASARQQHRYIFLAFRRIFEIFHDVPFLERKIHLNPIQSFCRFADTHRRNWANCLKISVWQDQWENESYKKAISTSNVVAKVLRYVEELNVPTRSYLRLPKDNTSNLEVFKWDKLRGKQETTRWNLH